MNGKRTPRDHLHLTQDDIDRIASAVSHTLRESIWSDRGIASQKDLKLMEQHILERLKTMPSAEEVKVLVAAAVAKETEQVKQAIKDAVADAIKNVPSNISDADTEVILSAIDSIHTPAGGGVPPVV